MTQAVLLGKRFPAKWVMRCLSLALFAAAWEWAARESPSLLLPTFTETVLAFFQLITTPVLWQALWTSNQAMVLGAVFAMVVGVPAGLLMGRWQLADRWLDPYLSILLAIPVAALIPIVIMALGFGLLGQMVLVSLFCLTTLIIQARAGMRLVAASWVEMARSLGATEAQLWREVFLPGAMPGILVGLRLGLGRAVAGMVAVELLLLAQGVGRLIMVYQGRLEAGHLYATILIVVLEALGLMHLTRWLERRLSIWRGPATDD